MGIHWKGIKWRKKLINFFQEVKEEAEKECDELLEFAKGLDYESYLADMEVLKFCFLLNLFKINYFNYIFKI